MLLTLSTTHKPATDLGFLLHKNPGQLFTADLAFGKAHMAYPEATDEKCTAAVILEVDPVHLVRGRKGPSGEGGLFDQYVNDRPYVASSFMSSALLAFFRSTMIGKSKERQELADTAIPLEVRIPVLACKGGQSLIGRIFGPLGYEIEAQRLLLDERFPEWGESRYYDVTLRAHARVQDVLSHLYVLLPVLDDIKHYWVDKSEIEKLLRRGESWLPAHPAKDEIATRYLRHQREFTREALARLAETELDPDEAEAEHAQEEEEVEKPMSLNEQRLNAVFNALKESGARRVVDLGCGEGKLLNLLAKDRQFAELVGVDVSYSMLDIAARRLKLDRPGSETAKKVKLLHGSLVYRDARLEGFEAATVVEVIEHLDPPRLASFERIVFEFAKPGTVVVTTPNREYNALFETLPADTMRHKDHRFEWDREQFQSWATRVAEGHGYKVRFLGIGAVDEQHGSPTQMAVFER